MAQLGQSAILSEFIRLNESIIVGDYSSNDKKVQQLRDIWSSRFKQISLETLPLNRICLDLENVNWNRLIELIVAKLGSDAVQEINIPRNVKSKLRAPKKPRKTPTTSETIMSASIELQKSKYAPTVATRVMTPTLSTITNTVFTHDCSDEDFIPNNLEEEKSDTDLEDSDEEMAYSQTSSDNNIPNVEKPTIEHFNDDMSLDWTQNQSPPIHFNFQHLNSSPHITPSRTPSLRMYVSDPPQPGSDPTYTQHSHQ
ncbi:hypothetical protein HPULCUR_006268 [Helicostylum pulchrum]|uniref:Uncharacterized protein n=1 Tax=Helicostylum pulchrum TaxID=562976 RepID=A0ABP9Y1G4_9FUNG